MSTQINLATIVNDTRESIPRAFDVIRGLNIVTCATIADYPLGFRERGECWLGTEHKKNHGFRTVRRTCKRGRWCKPKCSTYHAHPIVVVTGDYLGSREAAWLGLNDWRVVYIQAANGDVETLASFPHYGQPRREPKHYTVKSSRMAITSGGAVPEGPETVEQHTLPADPPELCDAWDIWESGYRDMLKYVAQQIESLAKAEKAAS
jgi:hypothetical protein